MLFHLKNLFFGCQFGNYRFQTCFNDIIIVIY